MAAASHAVKAPMSTTKGVYSYDPGLLIPIIALFGLSIIMVFSASMSASSMEQGPALSVLRQQSLFVFLAVTLMMLVSRIPLDLVEKAGPLLVLLSMLVLALILIPGVGTEVWGSVRWVKIGSVSIQPSEFAKVFLIIYLAGFLTRKQQEMRIFSQGILIVSIVLAVFGGLLLMEPDFGSTVVIVATVFGMMFLGGIRYLHFFIILGGAALGGILLVTAAAYRMQRITGFMDPWSDPMNKGYQLIQSYIAFGRGGWSGIGLGESIQKLNYLPAARTDFLFAVIGEELGFMGVMLVLGLFVALIWHAFTLSRRAESLGNLFACRLAQGVGLLIAIEVLMNTGVNMGVLPTKGLPLPFISQGGSSLLASSMAMGLLLAVARDTTPKPGRKR